MVLTLHTKTDMITKSSVKFQCNEFKIRSTVLQFIHVHGRTDLRRHFNWRSLRRDRAFRLKKLKQNRAVLVALSAGGADHWVFISDSENEGENLPGS
jgi:hypothetical protein